MRRVLLTFLAASSLAASIAANAADPVSGVLGFDELGASPVGVHLPDGYGGFEWGDRWYYMTQGAAQEEHFLATSTVGSTVIRRSDGADFYFDGADFWSRRGLDANGDFFFVLYHDGQTVYQGNLLGNDGRMRFFGTPSLLTPGYAGPIDGMALGFDNDDYDHLAMDNFRFPATPIAAAPVPEPGRYALFLAGLGLLGLVARRRTI